MTSPQRVMIIAWGSRGDMQPVTALALGLKKAGREVLVFGTPPSIDLAIANGIDCIAANENIVEFMKHRPVYIGFGSMKGNPEFCRTLSTLAIRSLQLAAGIRAGSPTVICAMQGDQPFHGSIAQARGIGKYLGMVGSPKLTAESVAAGIKEVTTDQSIVAAARNIGEQVRLEEGVTNAIRFIDRMAASFSYPWKLKN